MTKLRRLIFALISSFCLVFSFALFRIDGFLCYCLGLMFLLWGILAALVTLAPWGDEP